MGFLERIKELAKLHPAKIIFPEGIDVRILTAVGKIIEEGTAKPFLLGDIEELKKIAKLENINVPWEKVPVIDPTDSDYIDRYTELLIALRADKGMTPKKAREQLKNPCYFATMMLYHEEVDAMIAGATWSTADTIKPAFEIIKSKEEFHRISSFFFMVQEKKDNDPSNDVFLFADSAINIDPTAEELAEIAIDTAETAKRFNIEPKVAMLSFSTNGSGGDHPSVEKIQKAVEIAQKKRPDLIIEGEMQVDSALIPEVCEQKFPNSKIQGRANVLIFPDLNSGNISYKLVQRLGKYKALGPITQGLARPVNDLSRGCSVDDIINMAAISSIEVMASEYI
ncbi:MAG: phosphate acetyltransferase [Candidatus Peregrinibacteria bacterium]|nr:phosphate acetyltransferase [Candidatus Peregrinibacteria bacterium]MDZ4244774.1 phosphate acetyltransferase [Candidatus Gracilibacteria bacterium]